jgi:hypothetical protein
MERMLADMPEVSVTAAGYTKKAPKQVLSVCGLPSKGETWTHANDVANVVESVHERVLGRTADGIWERTLQPEAGAFMGDLLVFRRRVVRRVGSHSLPWTTEQFVGHYRGQKRNRYAAAAASLERKALSRKDSYPSVFLKAEKWHDPKAGRLISARPPRYNLALGRYILPLEHELYKAIDGVYGSATIMKGYTPEQRAAVVEEHCAAFNDWVAVGQDFSKFDQHISADALRYEHGFYLGAFGGDSELQRLLAWQLGTKCFANVQDGTVRYEVVGGRMSGDMNTALGNCIISAALVWAYARERGIKIRLMVDGDDSVAFMERADVARYQAGIQEWMARRGFRLVSEEPVDLINQVEFCQCRYVGLSPSTMVRNPLKAITQDHAWVEDRTLRWADVLAATGMGGLALYGNVPLLGAYYHMLARTAPLSAKVLSRLDTRSSWLRDATYDGVFMEPSERSRFEFWKAWGMEPGAQRAHEARFEAIDLSALMAIDTTKIKHSTFSDSRDAYYY